MILFRNIKSVFQLWPLLAALLVLSASLAASSQLRAAETVHGTPKTTGQPAAAASHQQQTQEPPATDTCGSETPNNPIFRNLKRIALVVVVTPASYQTAFDCHGNEEKCLDENGGLTATPSKRPKVRQEMLDDYTAYPEPLHPDNLVKVFSRRLRQEIPSHDEHCNAPDIALLDMNHWMKFQQEPDVLTVGVELHIVDFTKPRIAVVSINYYRSKLDSLTVQNSFSQNTAIPLDIPNDKIASLLSEFVDSIEVRTDPY